MTDTNLPHSRACGIRRHAHGSDCHQNCPTCHGRDDFDIGLDPVEIPILMMPVEIEATAANLLIRARSLLVFQDNVLAVSGSRAARPVQLVELIADVEAWLSATRVPAYDEAAVADAAAGPRDMLPWSTVLAVGEGASAYAKRLGIAADTAEDIETVVRALRTDINRWIGGPDR